MLRMFFFFDRHVKMSKQKVPNYIIVNFNLRNQKTLYNILNRKPDLEQACVDHTNVSPTKSYTMGLVWWPSPPS